MTQADTTASQVAKVVQNKLREKPNFYGSIEFNFKGGQTPTANIKESVRVGGADVVAKETR